MSSASVSTREEKSFIASRYSADATSTKSPGASKYRVALGSGPGRKLLTASFSQSGSIPSRSATAAAACRTELVGAKTASRSRVARRESKHSAMAAPPTSKISARCPAAILARMQVLRTGGECHQRRAGLESYPTQGTRRDKDSPSTEGRGRLLKCGRVHPLQRRYEPPLAGVPPGLARPRGNRPVVTSSQVLGERREGGIYLRSTRQRRLAIEPLGRNGDPRTAKIMRVVVKELDDDIAPDRLKRLALSQEFVRKQRSTSGIQSDRCSRHGLPPRPRADS